MKLRISIQLWQCDHMNKYKNLNSVTHCHPIASLDLKENANLKVFFVNKENGCERFSMQFEASI